MRTNSHNLSSFVLAAAVLAGLTAGRLAAEEPASSPASSSTAAAVETSTAAEAAAESANALIETAEHLLKEGDNAQALMALEKAREMNPSSPKINSLILKAKQKPAGAPRKQAGPVQKIRRPAAAPVKLPYVFSQDDVEVTVSACGLNTTEYAGKLKPGELWFMVNADLRDQAGVVSSIEWQNFLSVVTSRGETIAPSFGEGPKGIVAAADLIRLGARAKFPIDIYFAIKESDLPVKLRCSDGKSIIFKGS